MKSKHIAAFIVLGSFAAVAAFYLTACSSDDRAALKARVIKDGKTVLGIAEESALSAAESQITKLGK